MIYLQFTFFPSKYFCPWAKTFPRARIAFLGLPSISQEAKNICFKNETKKKRNLWFPEVDCKYLPPRLNPRDNIAVSLIVVQPYKKQTEKTAVIFNQVQSTSFWVDLFTGFGLEFNGGPPRARFWRISAGAISLLGRLYSLGRSLRSNSPSLRSPMPRPYKKTQT